MTSEYNNNQNGSNIEAEEFVGPQAEELVTTDPTKQERKLSNSEKIWGVRPVAAFAPIAGHRLNDEQLTRLMAATKDEPWDTILEDETMIVVMRLFVANSGEGVVMDLIPVASKVAGVDGPLFETVAADELWKETDFGFGSRRSRTMAQTASKIRRNSYRLPNKSEQVFIGGRHMTANQLRQFHMYTNRYITETKPGKDIGVFATVITVEDSEGQRINKGYWARFGRSVKSIVNRGRHPGDKKNAQGVHGMYWELTGGTPLRAFVQFNDTQTFNYLASVLTNTLLEEDDEKAAENYVQVAEGARQYEELRTATFTALKKEEYKSEEDADDTFIVICTNAASGEKYPVVVDGRKDISFAVYFNALITPNRVNVSVGDDLSFAKSMLMKAMEFNRRIEEVAAK